MNLERWLRGGDETAAFDWARPARELDVPLEIGRKPPAPPPAKGAAQPAAQSTPTPAAPTVTRAVKDTSADDSRTCSSRSTPLYGYNEQLVSGRGGALPRRG